MAWAAVLGVAVDWFEPIGEYCEREGPGFWAEPINAWTNLALVAAAVALVPAIRRHAPPPIPGRPQRAWPLWVLDALLVGVAAGSFLFHTFANRWSEAVDVGFIYLWILWFIWLYQRRRLALGAIASAGGLVGLAAASVVVVPLLGAYVWSYGPTLLVAAALGVTGVRKGRPGSRHLLAATACLVVALAAALLDEPLCGVVPGGTHWLWHVVNAGTFYLATRSLLDPATPTDPTALTRSA